MIKRYLLAYLYKQVSIWYRENFNKSKLVASNGPKRQFLLQQNRVNSKDYKNVQCLIQKHRQIFCYYLQILHTLLLSSTALALRSSANLNLSLTLILRLCVCFSVFVRNKGTELQEKSSFCL